MFSTVPLFYKVMVHFENTGQERKAPKPLKKGRITKLYMYAKKREIRSVLLMYLLMLSCLNLTVNKSKMYSPWCSNTVTVMVCPCGMQTASCITVYWHHKMCTHNWMLVEPTLLFF